MWTSGKHSLLKRYDDEQRKVESEYDQTGVPLSDWQCEFEYWYMHGQLAHVFRLPLVLYKRQLKELIRKHTKPVKRWHLQAYYYARKNYNRRVSCPTIVALDYEYPIPPKGWFLDFIVFPSGEVSLDLFHPNHNETYCSREGLPTLPLPVDENGKQVLSCFVLDRLSLPYMTTCSFVEVGNAPSYLKSVK